ncbi:MAG: hypothetical protein JSS30_01440 [Verrucomicrobia bacterium]|nr:hypothetical protein [Verrucomicrobiota bacterium]
MAIYQIFEEVKNESFTETFETPEPIQQKKQSKSHLFSTLVTRVCFLLLLLADSLWVAYNSVMLLIAISGLALTGGKNLFFKKMFAKTGLHFRRSVTCGLALFIGLFSPPFGIMVACTYFLMYDKAGMDEVVPAPLQAQFKDIFKAEK